MLPRAPIYTCSDPMLITQRLPTPARASCIVPEHPPQWNCTPSDHAAFYKKFSAPHSCFRHFSEQSRVNAPPCFYMSLPVTGAVALALVARGGQRGLVSPIER